jgi:hypothetical protein
MLREQKTVKAGCPCEDRVELEGNVGAQSISARENGLRDGAEYLIVKLLGRNNLNRAYKRVKQNGGAAGVDGMTVNEMLPYLKEHGEGLKERIRRGKYKPQPVRRVKNPETGWRGASTWSTSGHRPNGTTGVGASIAANIRTDIFGQQLWLSSGSKCAAGHEEGKGILRTRLQRILCKSE